MKKLITFLSAAVIFTFTAIAQTETPSVSAEESEKCFKILENYLEIVPWHGDYSATLSMVVEKPGKPKENLQFKVFERFRDKEVFFTTVQIFPEADKGKGYLKNGENFWSYDPISRKFTHVSIKEAVGDSDVSYDDLQQAKESYRKNYEIFAHEEGMLGKIPVDIITLKAKTSDPKYAKTRLYMRKDVPLVLKQEQLSASDRLMRTELYPKYTKVPQGYVATQIIYRDELNKGEQTQQVISDLTFDTLPDKIFTKAYLEGLN